MKTILVFLKRDWAIYKSYKLQVVIQFLSLIFFLVIIFFLSKLIETGSNSYLDKYKGNYTSFLVVGILFQWFASASLNSFAKSIREEQKLGTLEFLLFCPKNLIELLIGSSIYKFLKLFVQSAIMIFLVKYVFLIEMSSNLLPSLLIIILLIFSLSGIGFMSAGIILAFKQGDPINWIFTTLSTFLSGVFFPVEMLPKGLRDISAVLPTTHALDSLRKLLILNSNLDSILSELYILICFSVVSLLTGIFLLRLGFKYARIKGSLSSY